MTHNLKCDKCEGTTFTLLASKMQGLNKVIDIFLCKNCKANKIVTTVAESNTPIDTPVNIDSYGDGDDVYEEVLEEPENPYEDDDGGWDPSIG